MKKIIKSGVVLSSLIPAIAFAEGKDLKYIIDIVIKYFNYAIWLIMGLAIVMFVWNIYKYFIAGSDDVSSKKDAGLYVMWSIIGFFVILSFWGLVNILTRTFNLDNGVPSSFFGIFKSPNKTSLDQSMGQSQNTAPMGASQNTNSGIPNPWDH